jgi:hypothetical protein
VIVVVVVVFLLAGSSGGGGGVVVTSSVTTTSGTTTSGTIPTPPASPGEQFGANVNRLFNDGTYTQAQIDQQLSALQATGATIARSDALWQASETTAPSHGTHRYEWSFDDRIAGSLAAHGLRWLPIVDYSAHWAQSIPGGDHSPPLSAADYAAYAGALAARYGIGGTFWRDHPSLRALPVQAYEIWNEPDNPAFWSPAPDAGRYAALYAAASHAIGAVDPTARVLIGGLTNPKAFLPAMLSADPTLHVEAIAIHPYGATPAAVLANVATARHVADGLGIGPVPIYVTEFGWATRPPGARDGAPERLRPAYIRDTFAGLGASGCGVAASTLYTWVTPELDPLNHEDWFGISPPRGGTSPDLAAFTAGIRAAATATPSSASAC